MDSQQKLFPQARKNGCHEEELVIVFKEWKGEQCGISKRTGRNISVLHSSHYFPQTTFEGFHLTICQLFSEVSSTWPYQLFVNPEFDRGRWRECTGMNWWLPYLWLFFEDFSWWLKKQEFPLDRSFCVLRGWMRHLNICQLNSLTGPAPAMLT